MKKNITILFLALSILAASDPAMCQLPWELQETGTTLTLNGVDFITPDTGIVVGNQGMIMKTTDGGQTWIIRTPAVPSTNFNAVQYISATKIIAVGTNGVVVKSTDAGETWDQVSLGIQVDLNGLSIDRTSGKGLVSGATQLVLWTNDWGETWSQVQGGYMSDFYKAFMTTGNFGVTFGENSIFQPVLGYTMNGGATFDMWNFYPESFGVLYEGKANDGFFFAQNKGFVVGRIWDGRGFITKQINWFTHEWSSLLVNAELNAIGFLDEGNGVAAGGTDADWIFLETADSGSTWTPATVNGNGHGFREAVLVGNTGYAVGWSGQIVKKHIPVGVDEMQVPQVSMTVFPNPAGDKTSLVICLDKPQHISLSISDPVGQISQIRFSGELPEGKNIIPLDMRGMPGGIYICILHFNGGTLTRKLVID